MKFRQKIIFHFFFFFVASAVHGQLITAAGQPAQLDIRVAGEHSLRITLKPVSYKESFPSTPAVVEKSYPVPLISLRQLNKVIKKRVGSFVVEVKPEPLRVIVTNTIGQPVQDIIFENDGNLSFKLNGQPVLGMGEGGPKPVRGTNW